MDSYVDVRVLPDPEFTSSTLMNALFSKLHRVLADLKSTGIGVSFPEVDQKVPGLGRLLRLHGARSTLDELMKMNWLQGMRDHVNVAELKPVPPNPAYVVVRRVQAKSNPERLRRRLMKRHNISEEEARQRIPDTVAGERLKLPFISLKSQSTRQRFRIFIEHLQSSEQQMDGSFNAYGLSAFATVPWF